MERGNRETDHAKYDHRVKCLNTRNPPVGSVTVEALRLVVSKGILGLSPDEPR